MVFVNGVDSKRGFTFIRTFFGFGYGLYDRQHPDGSFKVGRYDSRGKYHRPLPGIVIGFIRFQYTYADYRTVEGKTEVTIDGIRWVPLAESTL